MVAARGFEDRVVQGVFLSQDHAFYKHGKTAFKSRMILKRKTQVGGILILDLSKIKIRILCKNPYGNLYKMEHRRETVPDMAREKEWLCRV